MTATAHRAQMCVLYRESKMYSLLDYNDFTVQESIHKFTGW